MLWVLPVLWVLPLSRVLPGLWVPLGQWVLPGRWVLWVLPALWVLAGWWVFAGRWVQWVLWVLPALWVLAGQWGQRLLPGRRVLPTLPHLVATDADAEVVEVLEALGSETGAAGEGGAGGQRREVVVQDMARQLQGEAAVVVAEGAELGGTRGRLGTATGWCHPAGVRYCHLPRARYCHPPAMARRAGVTTLGTAGDRHHPSRVR